MDSHLHCYHVQYIWYKIPADYEEGDVAFKKKSQCAPKKIQGAVTAMMKNAKIIQIARLKTTFIASERLHILLK